MKQLIAGLIVLFYICSMQAQTNVLLHLSSPNQDIEMEKSNQVGINIVATNAIRTKAQAQYKAEKQIVLAPGFLVEEGSKFEANIGICSSCLWNKVASPNLKPAQLQLISVYPNPVETTATIQYKLTQLSNLKIILIDINGRAVQKLLQTTKQLDGTYELDFNRKNLPSGIYTIQCMIDQQPIINQRVLLK